MNLEIYFDYSFALIHNFKWSISDIENMLPWERDIYLDKLITHIKEENQKIEEQNRKMKHG